MPDVTVIAVEMCQHQRHPRRQASSSTGGVGVGVVADLEKDDGLGLQCAEGKRKLFLAKQVSTVIGICWHERHPRQPAAQALTMAAAAIGRGKNDKLGLQCVKGKGEERFVKNPPVYSVHRTDYQFRRFMVGSKPLWFNWMNQTETVTSHRSDESDR